MNLPNTKQEHKPIDYDSFISLSSSKARINHRYFTTVLTFYIQQAQSDLYYWCTNIYIRQIPINTSQQKGTIPEESLARFNSSVPGHNTSVLLLKGMQFSMMLLIKHKTSLSSTNNRDQALICRYSLFTVWQKLPHSCETPLCNLITQTLS
jgi:hypothetical protein